MLTYADVYRYEAALLLHLRCRTDDLKLAAQYRRIGEVYKKQGRLRMALQWCSQSLHIRMRMLGPTHCAQSCYNVAQIHLHLSNFDAALPVYVAAVNCHSEAARGGQVAGERQRSMYC
jgi:tetratricopeptide (TPR) repeat protein